jgi:circadian clock protein KaiB
MEGFIMKDPSKHDTPALPIPEDDSSCPDGWIILKLFVSGNTPRSTLAIQNLRQVCEAYIHGRYYLEVVDIYQAPEIARREQIVATPTLVRYVPQPRKLLIGDLSQTRRILAGLGIGA